MSKPTETEEPLNALEREFPDNDEIEACRTGVRELIDQIKYHKHMPTTESLIQLLEGWIGQLDDFENHLYTQEEVESSRLNAYAWAKVQVVTQVLKNTKLKTRGEMIEAVEKLELV